jgi:hypothetical protein
VVFGPRHAGSSGVPVGVVVGACVGAASLIAIATAGVLVWRRRQRRVREADEAAAVGKHGGADATGGGLGATGSGGGVKWINQVTNAAGGGMDGSSTNAARSVMSNGKRPDNRRPMRIPGLNTGVSADMW